jgi:rhamnosyltransferase|tara:strand:+ start:272 stop:910 length:639 start_codon:yes stop_codon:yes gene_type:complete
MISVIVRNRNEEQFIGHAIQSVIDNISDFEIIVVDNMSTDDSIDIVKMFNFEDIKIETITNYSPGRSINLGVQRARGDLVMVLSAHSQIMQKINEPLIASYLEKYCCVFGKQVPIYRGKKISKRYVWSHFVDQDVENMWSDLENRYFLHNAFSVFNRDFLLKNKFDESLPTKEDRYWVNNDIHDKKYKTFYKHDMICHHHWTPNGATWKGIG